MNVPLLVPRRSVFGSHTAVARNVERRCEDHNSDGSAAVASGADSSVRPARLPVQRRQFVILEHDHPFLHWDFLVEEGEGLASWRLSEFPQKGHCVPATELPIHRTDYLTWEGPVSGNRGNVQRVYSGALELDGIWPNLSDWPGLPMRMIECPLAQSCQLIRQGHDALLWKFG
ncbi:MAG: hypothetical protein ABGZ35_26595 [Planctomycetaceae bacterium]